jgi:hypothetical protein
MAANLGVQCLSLQEYIDVNEESLLHVRSKPEAICLLNCRRSSLKLDILMRFYCNIIERGLVLKDSCVSMAFQSDSSALFLNSAKALIGRVFIFPPLPVLIPFQLT